MYNPFAPRTPLLPPAVNEDLTKVGDVIDPDVLRELDFGGDLVIEADEYIHTILRFEDSDWIGIYKYEDDRTKLIEIVPIRTARLIVQLIEENQRRLKEEEVTAHEEEAGSGDLRPTPGDDPQ